jgi:multiple antibiotic resistance protein
VGAVGHAAPGRATKGEDGPDIADRPSLAREFVALLVAIGPIGTIPVPLCAVQGVPPQLHRRISLRAVAIATPGAPALPRGGHLMSEAVGLRSGSFQIAGGIILFRFALSTIFSGSKAEREIHEAECVHMAGAVFPLAMPSIASPGAMPAVVIPTRGESNPPAEQALTAKLPPPVPPPTLAVALAAGLPRRLIGDTGGVGHRSRHGHRAGDHRGRRHPGRLRRARDPRRGGAATGKPARGGRGGGRARRDRPTGALPRHRRPPNRP